MENYGGFWVRVLATSVDSVICFTLIVVAAAALAMLGGIGMALITPLSMVLPIAYYALMQSSARQATFGKSLLGMKVATAGGERMSLGRAIARELAKIVSYIPLLLGFLLAAFTARKQALHDMIASTVVTRESSGNVFIALLVGVLGWAAPIALIMAVGVGLFAGMMGGMAGGMAGMASKGGGDPFEQAMRQAIVEAEKEAKRQSGNPRPAAPARPALSPAPKPSAPVAEAPRAPAPAADAPKAAPAPEPKVAMAPMKEQTKPSPAPRAELKVASLPPMQARPSEAPVAMAPEVPMRAAPRYNDLMSAVLAGDSEGVKELLSLGKWPDKPDSGGMTPLVAAVMRGDRSNAELLLKAGANASPALSTPRARNDPAMKDLLEGYRR
jgi:uncharacterized RDD family membrane protein YckC